MAMCIQCGKEYPSEAVYGVCSSCAEKERALTPDEQEEKKRILNIGSSTFGEIIVPTHDRVMDDPEVQKVGADRLLMYLRGGFLEEALRIREGFQFPSETVRDVARAGVSFEVITGHFLEARTICESFHLPIDDVRLAVRDAMRRFWMEASQDDTPSHPDDLFQMRQYFDVPFDQTVLLFAFAHGSYQELEGEISTCEPCDLDKSQRELWEFYVDPSVSEKVKTAFETTEMTFQLVSLLNGFHPEIFSLVGDQSTESFYLSEEGQRRWTQELSDRRLGDFMRARLTHGVSPAEYEQLYHDARYTVWNFKDVHRYEEERIRLAHEILAGDPTTKEVKEKIAEWRGDCLIGLYGGGDETIVRSYLFLKNTVGGPLLLEFLNRPNLSLHDALQCDFVLLSYVHKNWPWGPDDPKMEVQDSKFNGLALGVYQDLMLQVARDHSSYEVGSSYLEFARVLKVMEHTSIKEVLAQAQSSSIPGLSERIAKLSEPKFDPRRTWVGLKAIAGIKELLDRAGLADLSGQSPELSRFVGGLLESPVISTDAIEDFVSRPHAFLDRGAKYVTDENQRHAFSPARFAEVPRTGLTYEMVRDALLDGTLDRLQLLSPYEQTYLMTEQGRDVEDSVFVREQLVKALGQRSKGIKGEARDAKGLFQKTQQWVLRHVPTSETGESLTPNGASAILRKWVQDGFAPEIPQLALRELVGRDGMLYDKRMGIDAPVMFDVRARVGSKSDPTLRASAESVANCMPFGDGKTNTYDWNPAISQMVVERKMEDGSWKAMAQSVLMIDHVLDTIGPTKKNRNAAEIIQSLRDGQHASDVLTEEDLIKRRVLVADNIEPNLNELDAGRKPVIEEVYRRFGKEYLQHLPKELFLDATRLVVGKEYYDTMREDWDFTVKPNVVIPGSPVSYMDSVGTNMYEISFEGEVPPADHVSVGVVDIDASHVLAMSFLEGKSFQDNASLVFGLADRYQRILATNIAQEHFHDPNFMFMLRGNAGRVGGYLLARMNRTNPSLPEVYIDDIGVDRTKGLASGRYAMRLIDAFVERYVEHFSEGEEFPPPIYAEMREATSFQLVTRKLDKLASRFKYEMVEMGESSMGVETFKRVGIVIGRTDQELKFQLDRYADIDPEKLLYPEMSAEPERAISSNDKDEEE